MALVYRINVNCCSLFNTFSSKGVSNAKRFISQYGSKNSLNFQNAYKIEYHNLFKRVIEYRQRQARKSVIVKIKSFAVLYDFRNFCEHFGNVVNIFPYMTMNGQYFVLVEFKHHDTIQKLTKNLTSQLKHPEMINITSPIFTYTTDKLSKYSQEEYTDYSAFTIPKQTQIVEMLKPLKTIEEQMTSLYCALKFSEIDIRLRFYTAEELRYYLNRLFVNLDVVPFGSSVNGFGQRGCDLDLVCTIHGINNAHKLNYFSNHVQFDSKEKHQHFLEIAYVILNTCVPTICNTKRILNARVPILKFTIYNTNMKCDLTSPNITSLEMSKLLYIFAEIDYRVKPLVCTIRKWAQVHQITKENPGHWITNFSLTLLIIFYLQNVCVLPSISALNQFIVQNNGTSKKWISLNKISLHEALVGFFEFYRKFDFKMLAICIRHGKPRKKLDNSPVYIYNPLEESLNVSKNINQLELTRFIHCLQDALQLLTDDKECAILRLLQYDVTSPERNIGSKKHNINDNTVEQKQPELEETFDLTKPEKVKEIIN